MLDRARGLLIGHALGSAIGIQTKMRMKSDGATVSFPSVASYRGRPPCAWSAVTDMVLILLHNKTATGIAADLSDWAAGKSDYIHYGGMTAFERLAVENEKFATNPHEVAAELWRKSGGNATFAEPAAYGAAIFGDWDAAKLLYASPRSQFAAEVVSNVLSRIVEGNVNTTEDIDDLIAYIGNLSVELAKKIKPIGVFTTFDAEVSHWIRIGYEGPLAGLQLDAFGGVNDPIRVLGCLAFALRCIRYSILAGGVVPNFRKIIYKIADECGNADVNTSIVGATLGAYLGYAALPPAWVSAIHDVGRLRSMVDTIITESLTHTESSDGDSSSTITDDNSTDLSSVTRELSSISLAPAASVPMFSAPDGS